MKPTTAIIIVCLIALVIIGVAINRPIETAIPPATINAEMIDRIESLQLELERKQEIIDTQRAELYRQRTLIAAQASAASPSVPEATRSPVHALNAETLEEMRRAAEAVRNDGK